MGPESRIHPRSVGTRKKSTASRLAPDFFKMVRTRDSDSRFSTSRNTRSTLDKCRTISANAQGIGANFPGQSVSSCGQPSQVASWRSHSAGIRKPRACGELDCGSVFIGAKNLTQRFREYTESTEKRRNSELREEGLFFAQPTIQDWRVRVDAAVAQKRPIAARVFAFRGIALNDENFFFVVRGFGENLPEGIGDKGIAPELQPRIAFLRLAFKSHAIDDRSVDAVGDGMAALDRFPGIELCGAELRFFVRVPADAGWIKNHLRAAEGGEARTFRIPLVPADLHADARVLGIKIRETEIAGGEIKLFVVQGIVGNVHFAVFSEKRSVRVEDGAGVVVNAWGAALEERNDQRDFLFLRNLRECFGRRAGNGFGEIEKFRVFGTAEVFAMKKFVQGNNLRAARRGFADFLDGSREVFVAVRRAFHLHESDRKFVSHEN